MHEEFSWREKRLRVNWKPGAPFFSNFGHNFPTAQGHVSLYCYTESDQREIARSGTVKKWCPTHYSTELIVDCDTLDSTNAVRERLESHQVSFRQFSSGNKGCHFHVDREAEPSTLLCLQDKTLVESLFDGVELDTGVYKPMHLIRAISCVHEKTRKPKHLVKDFVGPNVLSVMNVELQQRQVDHFKLCETSDDRSNWRRFQDRVLLHQPVGGKGSRNAALFCLAKDMYKSGLSVELVTELCEFFNDAFQIPHDHVEVLKAVHSAIAHVGEQ